MAKMDVQLEVGSHKDKDVFVQAKNVVKETVKTFLKKYKSVNKA
jgi:hypothetical protein